MGDQKLCRSLCNMKFAYHLHLLAWSFELPNRLFACLFKSIKNSFASFFQINHKQILMHHHQFRLLNAPTVTKLWHDSRLRYYLQQLFGDTWKSHAELVKGKPIRQTSRQGSLSTVRRRSRITYDRVDGMRVYRGAEYAERGCSCDDI